MKTVFLWNVSIHRNLCFKLQKVDKGDGTRHNTPKLWLQYFRVYKNYLWQIETSHTKTAFTIINNLVFMLNLILEITDNIGRASNL